MADRQSLSSVNPPLHERVRLAIVENDDGTLASSQVRAIQAAVLTTVGEALDRVGIGDDGTTELWPMPDGLEPKLHDGQFLVYRLTGGW